MTTTDKFQKLPDFYTDENKKECVKYSSVNTNPRYRNFNQLYFTAGDVEQFNSYRDPTNNENSVELSEDILKDNVWYDFSKRLKEMDYPKIIKDVVENVDWEKYRNLSTESVDHTFHYIFDKFKKGVFIKIKNNKLTVFLPFSKHDYYNEFHAYLKHDPSSFSDMTQFIQYASKISGYDIPKEKINRFVNTWYANNCLIRPEFPIGENDRGLANMKDMFLTLCKERVVPDIEFFINKRDFPLITKNEHEPYDQIFGKNFPLLSHNYKNYSPILSMVTSNKNSDIPSPTHEDWARVSSQEDNKFFSPDCRDYRHNFSKDWSKRIPTAVFRGASTGCGVTIDTNPRLKLAFLSDQERKISALPILKYEKINAVKKSAKEDLIPLQSLAQIQDSKTEKKGIPLLDAGITKWNLRPRKIMDQPYLQLIDPKQMTFGLVGPLTPEEQANYKYIVNVDGHVSAFRLSLEMSMGCTILLADSKYRVWFRRYLKPYVHYVPVEEDLSNLYTQIIWCREHDKECMQIALNAKEFYDTYLSKKGILDYLQYLLFKLKKATGTYFYNMVNVDDIIMKKEMDILIEYQETFPNNSNSISISNISYPFPKDTYYTMKGLEMFLRGGGYRGVLEKDGVEIHRSKDTVIYEKKFDVSFSLKQIMESRRKEIVNEAFTGIEINHLIREIPHFRYTYLLYENTLISQHVNGITLKDYIMSGCTISQLRDIFIMVSLALAVAQERIGFVHYDLSPWNIIITKTEKQVITYQFKESIFTVETDVVPVIIDYGRAHIIRSEDKNHYGTIEPFKMGLFQDCFFMVISSIYEIMTRKTNKIGDRQLSEIFYVINFYSNTNFQKNKIETYDTLMEFLVKNKKYNEIIFGNKCDLEKKDPSQLFFHLCELESVLVITQINYPEKIDYPLEISNGLFYYDLIMNENEAAISDIHDYLERIENRYESLLENSPNFLVYINACNMIDMTVQNVVKFLDFMKKMGYKDKEDYMKQQPLIEKEGKVVLWSPVPKTMKKLYFTCQRIRNRISTKILITDKKELVDLDLDYFTTNIPLLFANYTPKTFTNPQEILTIIQSNIKNKDQDAKDDYLLVLREMMIANMFYNMPFGMQDEEKFVKDNGKLILLHPLTIRNNQANIETLHDISRELYTKEKPLFERMEHKPEKYLLCLKNILELI